MNRLRLFERWLHLNTSPCNLEDIFEETIRDYIIDLQQRGKYTMFANELSNELMHLVRRRDCRNPISNTTINNYLRNLRAIFNWLEEMEYIVRSPMHKMKLLQAERKPKEYLTDEQIHLLLKSYDRSYFSECRDYTVILLLLDTGMRVGEASPSRFRT